MTIARSLQRRAVYARDFWGDWAAGNEPSRTISQGRALQHVAVYAAVRALSEDVGSLPVDVFRRSSEGVREPLPVPAFIATPNRELTRMELFERIMFSLNLSGNAYCLVTYNNAGSPVELTPIPPDRVHVSRDQHHNLVYLVTDDLGAQHRVEFPNLVHVRGLGDGIKGLSPIQLAARSIGVALAADEFGEDWFEGGAMPSSLLETDQQMKDDDANRQLAKWIASRQGRRRPALLHSGLKWRQIQISPEESQFLETRRFQVTEIARLFRVPPHMIGDLERATFSNIEHQSIDYVVHSLRPWCVRIEQAMRWLFPPGVEFRFNVDGLLRGDVRARFEAYNIGRQIGVYNPDDIRQLEDLPPIPGGAGKDYAQPLNWGPLGVDPTQKGATP